MAKRILQIARILIVTGINTAFLLTACGTEKQQPSLLYIDVQQHLWGSPRGGRGITAGGPLRRGPRSPLKRRELRHQRGPSLEGYCAAAANLLTYMDRYGVEKTILLPPPRIYENLEEGEIENLKALVEKYPNRFYLVGGGAILNAMIQKYPPGQVTEEVKRRFRKEAERLISMGIKAFGEMAALHISFTEEHVFEESPPDHPLFLLLADIAAEYNIPIDLHMEAVPKDMPTPAGLSRRNAKVLKENIRALERLLKYNRRTRIVWLHLGWDNTGGKTIALIRRLLKEHANLYCALRIEERLYAMDGTPMPNRIVDEQWKIKDDWLNLFQEFPDRFVIGSDEFFGIPGRSPRAPQSFEETWALMEQLPEDLRLKIGRENARRIYNLD